MWLLFYFVLCLTKKALNKTAQCEIISETDKEFRVKVSFEEPIVVESAFMVFYTTVEQALSHRWFTLNKQLRVPLGKFLKYETSFEMFKEEKEFQMSLHLFHDFLKGFSKAAEERPLTHFQPNYNIFYFEFHSKDISGKSEMHKSTYFHIGKKKITLSSTMPIKEITVANTLYKYIESYKKKPMSIALVVASGSGLGLLLLLVGAPIAMWVLHTEKSRYTKTLGELENKCNEIKKVLTNHEKRTERNEISLTEATAQENKDGSTDNKDGSTENNNGSKEDISLESISVDGTEEKTTSVENMSENATTPEIENTTVP